MIEGSLDVDPRLLQDLETASSFGESAQRRGGTGASLEGQQQHIPPPSRGHKKEQGGTGERDLLSTPSPFGQRPLAFTSHPMMPTNGYQGKGGGTGGGACAGGHPIPDSYGLLENSDFMSSASSMIPPQNPELLYQEYPLASYPPQYSMGYPSHAPPNTMLCHQAALSPASHIGYQCGPPILPENPFLLGFPMPIMNPSTTPTFFSHTSSSQPNFHYEAYLEALQRKKRRRRLGSDETSVLMETFETNPKPNATIRDALAKRLNMTPRAIQIWFQNRRAKMKRDHADHSAGLTFSTISSIGSDSGSGNSSCVSSIVSSHNSSSQSSPLDGPVQTMPQPHRQNNIESPSSQHHKNDSVEQSSSSPASTNAIDLSFSSNESFQSANMSFQCNEPFQSTNMTFQDAPNLFSYPETMDWHALFYRESMRHQEMHLQLQSQEKGGKISMNHANYLPSSATAIAASAAIPFSEAMMGHLPLSPQSLDDAFESSPAYSTTTTTTAT
jgi:hypothetical protein